MKMNGKELVMAAMAGKTVERTPWVPFCGVHAGKLIGVDAATYLKSADHIVNGISRAAKLYRADGIPVVFDLQIEAEVLGCELQWTKENPPAVTSHPLADGKAKLEDLRVPGTGDGRFPILLDATRRLRQALPNLALYGLVTGPFTLALHLLGTKIFMDMFDDPAYVNRVLAFCAEVGKAAAAAQLDAGCDIIAVVDPMTSQIGPDQFEEFCQKPAAAIFSMVRERGAKSSFFVCGHAQNNIEVMCGCGCDNISIDENIPLDFVRDICRRKGVSFGGNIQLTTVMLLGTPEANRANAVQCLDIGGREGFILAPGCDMPYATPEANVVAIAEIVHDPYQQEIVRKLADDGQEACAILDMSDYGQTDKVIVDIITLDSEACAPCQYMVEAVKSVTPEFSGLVEWREHKIKNPESITMMSSLFVRNIPTICIDGQIRFVSRIPRREELIRAIYDRIRDKFALRLKYRRGRIILLGDPTSPEFAVLQENIGTAMKELGDPVDYTEITKPEEIRKFGIFQTPAVITTRYTVKSSGKVVDKAIIKEWIKSTGE